jgi:uncharacterized OB-fold protein
MTDVDEGTPPAPAPAPADDVTARIRAGARRIAESGESARRPGRDPVNLPMIRSWQEALGDDDPRYEAEGVAPPAMIQVWTMGGLARTQTGSRTADDPLGAAMRLLDDAGFTSVVATNCSQTYHRYLRVGEEVTVSTRLEDVVGPKRTALGEGWFVTTRNTWFVGDEPVAEMSFRVLKFRPPEPEPPAEPKANVIPPVVSRDTAFFWDGARERELRLQRCEDCGALRHPPGPVCTACASDRRGWVVATGTGVVHSYVVHHHPPVPGRTPPYVVALVELTEGVRMLGEVLDAVGGVDVGTPVTLDWHEDGAGVVLPAWRVTE